MSNSIILKYCNQNISTIVDINNIPWFKGTDVALALGYRCPCQAVVKKIHPTERKKIMIEGKNDQKRYVTYINEPGVYRLVFGSTLPFAEEFKTWVFTEVLPKLRKSVTLKNIPLKNEKSLHYNVIRFMKTFYPSVRLIPGLGEYQETKQKRIDAWNKGYIGGQPDIMIPLTVKNYNGLAIELKNPINKSKISPKQKEYHSYLKSIGWKVIVGKNYTTVTKEITTYMNQVKLSCQICKKYYIYQKSLKNHQKKTHKPDFPNWLLRLR